MVIFMYLSTVVWSRFASPSHRVPVPSSAFGEMQEETSHWPVPYKYSAIDELGVPKMVARTNTQSRVYSYRSKRTRSAENKKNEKERKKERKKEKIRM